VTTACCWANAQAPCLALLARSYSQPRKKRWHRRFLSALEKLIRLYRRFALRDAYLLLGLTEFQHGETARESSTTSAPWIAPPLLFRHYNLGWLTCGKQDFKTDARSLSKP